MLHESFLLKLQDNGARRCLGLLSYLRAHADCSSSPTTPSSAAFIARGVSPLIRYASIERPYRIRTLTLIATPTFSPGQNRPRNMSTVVHNVAKEGFGSGNDLYDR